MLTYAIDFGTTHSLLAAADADRCYPPIPLDPDHSDPTLLRTLLYFPNASECFYGTRAWQEFAQRDLQGRFLRSIKKFLPMRSFIGTFVEQRPFNLEDLIALFLREMKRRADAYFQQDGRAVVLGRPALFSEDPETDQYAQYRLERAARMAGFEHIQFLPEPVAAAREFRGQLTRPQVLLVVDLGGGTSDYTLLQVTPEPYSPQDVLAIGGVSVAGDALDGRVMRHWLAPELGAEVQYRAPFGSQILKLPVHWLNKLCSPAELSFLLKREVYSFLKDVRRWSLTENDRQAMDRLFLVLEEQLGFPLFEAIEKTKRALSDQLESAFSFSYPGLELQKMLSRPHFEEMIRPEAEALLKALDQTLDRAGKTFAEVDWVCCTGGTSQVPLIKQALVKRFGSEKVQGHRFFHSVVAGLAEQAREWARGASNRLG